MLRARLGRSPCPSVSASRWRPPERAAGAGGRSWAGWLAGEWDLSAQTAPARGRGSAHRCDLGHQSTQQGPGDYSTDESALRLHLDQAGGNWNREKPVELKITCRARKRWGVGVAAASQVLPRQAPPIAGPPEPEGEPARPQRGQATLVPSR